MPSLIHLDSATVTGELTPAGQRPGADSGDPQLATTTVDGGTQAQIGIWECQPGGWPVINRPNTETCYIISGAATLTDDDTGKKTEINAGDYLTLPPGWSGRWDVTETLRKAYTIF
ncbi:cupin domain-containing protein [Rhodococcus ruber]|uniref:Cupin domain-containing protein n=1 Tax=Rhodococcus ruber TaxID=1830 RepID=A0ABT4MEF6_9NOCA|nr:cupin domain-containing protein [Rhodococcus ruber]MCZ4519374.1 cupin domain-containing protein [Rhodococcus ruber]